MLTQKHEKSADCGDRYDHHDCYYIKQVGSRKIFIVWLQGSFPHQVSSHGAKS